MIYICLSPLVPHIQTVLVVQQKQCAASTYDKYYARYSLGNCCFFLFCSIIDKRQYSVLCVSFPWQTNCVTNVNRTTSHTVLHKFVNLCFQVTC